MAPGATCRTVSGRAVVPESQHEHRCVHEDRGDRQQHVQPCVETRAAGGGSTAQRRQHRAAHDQQAQAAQQQQAATSGPERVRPLVARHGPRGVHGVLERLAQAGPPVEGDQYPQHEARDPATEVLGLTQLRPDDR